MKKDVGGGQELLAKKRAKRAEKPAAKNGCVPFAADTAGTPAAKRKKVLHTVRGRWKIRKDLECRAACPGAETGRGMPYKPWGAARLPPPPAGADKTGRNILRGSIRKQSRKILTARRHLRRYRALHSKKECWGGTATKAPVGLSTGQTGLRSAQMPPVVFGRQG